MHLAAEHSVQSTVYITLVRRGSLSKYVLLINPGFFITTSWSPFYERDKLSAVPKGLKGLKGFYFPLLLYFVNRTVPKIIRMKRDSLFRLRAMAKVKVARHVAVLAMPSSGF